MGIEQICVFVVIFIVAVFVSGYLTLFISSMRDDDTNEYGLFVTLIFDAFLLSMIATYTLYETGFLV